MGKTAECNPGVTGTGPLNARTLVQLALEKRQHQKRHEQLSAIGKYVIQAVDSIRQLSSFRHAAAGLFFHFEVDRRTLVVSLCDGEPPLHPLVEEYLIQSIVAAGFEFRKVSTPFEAWVGEVYWEAA